MKECIECGNLSIHNKHFCLCYRCNQKRLSKNKKNKSKVDNSYFIKNIKENVVSMVEEDERFYKKCFDSCKHHNCEECGTPLPEIFRSFTGKILAKWRYSHIIPKSISKELRHNVKNINHLCLRCHQEWENGDKEGMGIYIKNKKLFPWYFL